MLQRHRIQHWTRRNRAPVFLRNCHDYNDTFSFLYFSETGGLNHADWYIQAYGLDALRGARIHATASIAPYNQSTPHVVKVYAPDAEQLPANNALRDFQLWVNQSIVYVHVTQQQNYNARVYASGASAVSIWCTGDGDCSQLDMECPTSCVTNYAATAMSMVLFSDDTCNETTVSETTEPETTMTLCPNTSNITGCVSDSVADVNTNTTENLEVFLQNHKDTEEWRVVFYIQNLDALACSIEVHEVEITDHGFYQLQWVANNPESAAFDDPWTFNAQGGEFSMPISVKIYADVDGMNLTFFACDIITSFIDYEQFPLTNIDLCDASTSMTTSALYDEYCNVQFDDDHNRVSIFSKTIVSGVSLDELLLILISAIFVIFSLIAYIHAKRKKNDYFKMSALIGVYFQMMDVYTDILFCLTVGSVYFYMHTADIERIEYLLIFVGSVLCIVGPIIASLFQLYSASSKYWLYQSRTRLWLLSFDRLLYLVSILSGSPFAAIDFFNSNLFGSDFFYMGIPKHFMMGFSSKKVYSVIFMEDVPQLLLSVWYTALVGHFQSVVAAQMTFSLISIIVTVISLVLKRRIYHVMDSVHISISIQGTDVVDEMDTHRNEIEKFKKFLCRSVLGVNERTVEIQKPFNGGLRDGVQLLIFISYIHEESNVDPAQHYEDLIQSAMNNNELQSIMKAQWKLSTLPRADDIEIECYFVESKARKKNQAHVLDHDNEGQGVVPMTTVATTSVSQQFSVR